MALSAQTLFHFTKFQHLKSILKAKAFYPRLSFEAFMNMEDQIVAFPMVCFCDIPLSQIYFHAIEYDRNGIGLNKEWGIKNGLNPAFYLQKESFPTKIIQEANKDIRKEIFAHPAEIAHLRTDDSNLMVRFYELAAFFKPRQGKTWEKKLNDFKKVSKRSQKDKVINFYNEREWRFVPDIVRYESSRSVKVNFRHLRDFYQNNVFQEKKFEQSNAPFKENKLEFSVSDLKYLIVSRVSDIGHLARFISELNNYTNEEKSILTSKIISLKQIQEDF